MAGHIVGRLILAKRSRSLSSEAVGTPKNGKDLVVSNDGFDYAFTCMTCSVQKREDCLKSLTEMQLFAPVYNPANSLRQAVLPLTMRHSTLTTLRETTISPNGE